MSTSKYGLVLSGWAALADKLNNKELVEKVVDQLADLLGLKEDMLNPFCYKMIHPDPRRTFVAGGIVAHSGTVLLNTFPGKKNLELKVFYSGDLQDFQETVQKIVPETFGLCGYEVDVHELENLQ